MSLTKNKTNMKTRATNVFLLIALLLMSGACKDKDTPHQEPGIP